MPKKPTPACNTCGVAFAPHGDAQYASLKNRRFCATLNKRGEVVAECCENCQQEVMEAVEDGTG